MNDEDKAKFARLLAAYLAENPALAVYFTQRRSDDPVAKLVRDVKLYQPGISL